VERGCGLDVHRLTVVAIVSGTGLRNIMPDCFHLNEVFVSLFNINSCTLLQTFLVQKIGYQNLLFRNQFVIDS